MNLFTKHPTSVGETYFEHMITASIFSLIFLYAGAISLIHAIFPFLFTKTGSSVIIKLHNKMVDNRSNKEKPPIWFYDI